MMARRKLIYSVVTVSLMGVSALAVAQTQLTLERAVSRAQTTTIPPAPES